MALEGGSVQRDHPTVELASVFCIVRRFRLTTRNAMPGGQEREAERG
jgi:hypothetical protein